MWTWVSIAAFQSLLLHQGCHCADALFDFCLCQDRSSPNAQIKPDVPWRNRVDVSPWNKPQTKVLLDFRHVRMGNIYNPIYLPQLFTSSLSQIAPVD